MPSFPDPAGHSRPSLRWPTNLLEPSNDSCIDVFRQLHPTSKDTYTCWSEATRAREQLWRVHQSNLYTPCTLLLQRQIRCHLVPNPRLSSSPHNCRVELQNHPIPSPYHAIPQVLVHNYFLVSSRDKHSLPVQLKEIIYETRFHSCKNFLQSAIANINVKTFFFLFKLKGGYLWTFNWNTRLAVQDARARVRGP